MADDTKPVAPATVPPTAEQQAISAANAAQKEAEQRKLNQNQVVTRKANSPIVTNPAPAEPEVPVEKPPESLPSTTIAEMAAGRAALEKNKPVAEALEDANRRRAAGETQLATNPVDNVTRTAPVANKV